MYSLAKENATQKATTKRRKPSLSRFSIPWEKISTLKKSEQRVYKFLLYFEGYQKDIGVKVSMRQLAYYLQLNKATICKAIRTLEAEKLISTLRIMGRFRPKSNTYRLIPHNKKPKPQKADIINNRLYINIYNKDKKPSFENDLLNFAAKSSFKNDARRRKFLFYGEKLILKRLTEVIAFKPSMPITEKKAWAKDVYRVYGENAWKALEGYIINHGKKIFQKGGIHWFFGKMELIMADFHDYEPKKTARVGLNALKKGLLKVFDFGTIANWRLNLYCSRLFRLHPKKIGALIKLLPKFICDKKIDDFAGLKKMVLIIINMC